MNAPVFLSRGIDYLGDLGAKLRDLQGYRTLAHELIQNADDVVGATSMTFDVRKDALVVDNDGVFSDCQQIELQECPWKTDDVHQHRCDFHRFRFVASGDKRGEMGTTGNFGIGFIAVYQITDRPELLSVGRHWILNEEKPEGQRIEVCSGCPHCLARNLPGTRFILPWAQDPNSQLRTALRAEAVPPDAPERLIGELEGSLGVAMLFLKRLRTIEIRRDGRLVRSFQRLDEADSLILTDSQEKDDRIWHLVRGGFSEAAEKLRQQHTGRIEPKRSADVTLAIPAGGLDAGLLCACLPTEQNEELPFHLNADFFTTNDRKRVILAADYQSEWNREALEAAAYAIGGAVERLPSLLGAKHFWQLVSRLEQVADRAEEGRVENTLVEFWNQIVPHLNTAAVIQTTTGKWLTAEDTCLLLQRDEVPAIEVLESLELEVVHEDLRPFQTLLRSVGVPVLDIEKITTALTELGLDRRTEPRDLPAGLKQKAARDPLWGEITILLDRQQRTPRARAADEQRLRGVALALGRDGAFWPCGNIYSADEETVALFESLGLGIPFVAQEPAFGPLNYLCKRFNVAAAVEALGTNGSQQVKRLWQNGKLPVRPLFEWLEDRRSEILSDAELKRRLGALPLFPSSGVLHPISKLALPGNFKDPLGLADLVDIDALGGRRQFLQDLGMPELDFGTYAASRLPAALSGSNVPSRKRRAAILLLASQVGVLKDNESACTTLAETAIVECSDGRFRKAEECHFDSDAVRKCLGSDTPIAVLPNGHEAAVTDLYDWVGVATEPRLESIVAVVRQLSSNQYSRPAARQIQTIVTHLGKRITSRHDFAQLNSLRYEKWLPARGVHDRWYLPSELYAIYQMYLFESQAKFLDVPGNIQNTSRLLLESLGIRLTPSVDLVVKHLLHCATQQIPVNPEVYRFLNEKAGDPALGQLRGKCLLLGGSYHSPNNVFWGEHPFGRYRRRLGEELRSYSGLLNQLGVREQPTWQDARSVLREIADDFGTRRKSLDDETHAVLMACWRAIGQALEDGATAPETISELHSVRCIPDGRRILNQPDWMFFENRAGLAAKFGAFLVNNVIPRPIGTGRALDAAGVRALGTAVQIELLECANPVDDPALRERLLGRRNLIGRVLEARGPGHDTSAVLKTLDNIRFQAATSIEIKYRLHAFNRELESGIEQVPALYQPDQQTLLFCPRNGSLPWPAIARELVIALFPEDDPGQLAAGVKEALAAESTEEAVKTLDELGFARLDTSATEPVAAAETVGKLGAVEVIENENPLTSDSVEEPEEHDDLTPKSAIDRLLGASAPSPSPLVVATDIEPSGTGGGGSSSRRPGESAQSRNRPPVLRSYVPAPNDGDAQSDDDETGDDDNNRSLVDQAGIRRVIEYETKAGRHPKEMPPKNPGFDIESRDGKGKIVRYIEVKSFSGGWSSTYAVLSRPQFNKARELADAFWLYVVERAESHDFQIHRIQALAVKANRFMFDYGWRATAEPIIPTSIEGQ